MERRVFRGMGTEIELMLEPAGRHGDVRRAFDAAEREFRRLEELLSRFRPESELSALNRERMRRVSSDTAEVIALALAARVRTRGRFDPTIHDALVAAGYDRSFESVPREGAAATLPRLECGGRVTLEPSTGLVVLGPGVRLDLGGIGKGYAVDRACSVLARAGDCLVNAGGDLAAAGERSWPVGVETHSRPITLELRDGALATSGRDRRRWRRGGEEHHHIIDPRTGRPADTDLLRVTVVAPTAVEAEALAKALFLAGSDAALAEADEARVPCVLVTEAGETLLAGGLS